MFVKQVMAFLIMSKLNKVGSGSCPNMFLPIHSTFTSEKQTLPDEWMIF
ncbi:hypothetical protein RG47T_2729 [Mucilaginibacter polytrichastri]|uniref:Uncharacterized protein n=1 Tax=Mucilaginibacter polytrichastri TaxID=1302689 RepID=A0A1Q5ZZS7_9SPHI|nr:hypothetical protein RG47T_2729 [Mucilaginibacter polytrichastri]